MALVVYDRVQETTTTAGTGSITLLGAAAGFQSFAVVGNGNTTFYTITDGSAWEVGIGTYSTSGPTLARTTVLSNSNGNTSSITLSVSPNIKQVFITYPSEKSVNLDNSGNVTALGTISSGTWQGTTVGVAYGGTGVISSSGVNSVMLRDSNANSAINNLVPGWTSTVSAAGTTTLTVASSYFQRLTGTTTQTFHLPDATTLTVGTSYLFDNDSTGNLSIVDNGSNAIETVAAGGYCFLFLESSSTANGSWGKAGLIPGEVNWGTNSLNLGGSTIITNGTWQGTNIATSYGGTGLTGFSAANNAIYSTSSSALTAGTLPVVAGGTGASSASITAFNNITGYSATGTTGTTSTNLVFSTSPALTTPTIATSITLNTSAKLLGDFTNSTISSRSNFQTSTANSTTGIYALPSGTGTAASWQATNNSDPTNTSKILIATNGSTDVQLVSGINGTGTYLPLSFYTNGSQQKQITTTGAWILGTGTTNYGTSGQVLTSSGNGVPTWSTISVTPNVVNKTANYTLTTTDGSVFCSASGGAFTITLPTAVSAGGKTYSIKKTDSSTNAVVVGTTSSQTIDGNLTQSLAIQNAWITVQSDGANWQIIG
jgi:hypothetical protein